MLGTCGAGFVIWGSVWSFSYITNLRKHSLARDSSHFLPLLRCTGEKINIHSYFNSYSSRVRNADHYCVYLSSSIYLVLSVFFFLLFPSLSLSYNETHYLTKARISNFSISFFFFQHFPFHTIFPPGLFSVITKLNSNQSSLCFYYLCFFFSCTFFIPYYFPSRTL